jgi:hypothetical protein
LGDGRPLGALVRGPEAAASAPRLATQGEEQAYSMMREILPRDAVVIESPRIVTDEPLPVLGERRLFLSAARRGSVRRGTVARPRATAR